MELASLVLFFQALPSALLPVSVARGVLQPRDSLGGREGAEGRAMPWTPRRHPCGGGGDVQGIVNQWCVDQPGRSVGRIGWPPLVTRREGCVGWLTTAQGVTPVQWRHVRAALVARLGAGLLSPEGGCRA